MSKNKKGGSRFGTIVGWIIASLLILGILFMLASKTSGEEPLRPGSWRLTLGMILFGLSIVITAILPFLPAKLRGVEEVPFKIKILQSIMSLSILTMVGGFAWIIYSMMRDLDNEQNFSALIGAGIFVVGFAVAWIAASIRDKMIKRGEASPDVITVMRAESDVHESEVGAEALKKVFGHMKGLTSEEENRELKRIEERERLFGAASMTKEQVERYEDMKHGRK